MKTILSIQVSQNCCLLLLVLFVVFFFPACAVIFFVLEDILLFHITLQSQGSSLPQLSVVVKATCTLIAWFTSIARRIPKNEFLVHALCSGIVNTVYSVGGIQCV